MKLSATVSAFLVLLVALALLGVAFESFDINTDVSTIDETLLPRSFDGTGVNYATGFSFRYPRGWEAIGQGSTILLSYPMDANDPEAPVYTFNMGFQQVDADQTINPVDYVGGEGELTVIEATGNTLAAARRVQILPDDTVTFIQLTRLTDDNVFVATQNTAPIALADWNEIDEDLFRTLNSMSVSPDFHVLHDALTFTLPENWEVVDSRGYAFIAAATLAEGETAQPFIRVEAYPADQIFGYLSGLQILPPTVTPDTPPLEIMDMFGDMQDPSFNVTEGPTDVTYFGLSGKAILFSLQGASEYRLLMLDGTDGYYVVSVGGVNNGIYADHAEEFEAILNSVSYTTPDPSVYPEVPQP